MGKKLIYLFLILFLFGNRTVAQVVFNRNYDLDSISNTGISVIQTLDGGYLVGGTNADFSTGSSRAILLKTNSTGDTLWTKEWDFSSLGGDQIRSLIQLTDSSYIALGNTYDTIALNWDVILLKLNPLGDTLWKKQYSIGTGIDLGYMVKQAADGGFIIAGRTTSNTSGPEDAYWIKTDNSGNMQWQYQYGGANIDAVYSVDLCSDGGYILGGQTKSYGAGLGDLFLIKINSLGIFQWRKTFGTIENDYGETVISTLDGGFIISGAIDDGTGFGSWNGYIVKTDNAGNMQWNKIFGYGTDNESLNLVRQLQDSTFVLAGSTRLNSSVKFQGWLMKVNTMGDSLWSHTYGSSIPRDDYFYGLDLTNDGGFILCGFYDTLFLPPYTNVWLVKTDCMGNDSAWDSASCSLTTSIPENVLENNFAIKVYPNPNNGQMTFEYELNGNAKGELSIYDVTGRKIANYDLSTGSKINTVSETSLNNGIYFYIYKINDVIKKSEKIVIIK